MTNEPFTLLLMPQLWSVRNRARRRERGDLLRTGFFGGIGLVVCGALFGGAYWLTTQLAAFEEFGDYLLRLGLSWLFLTFLGFLAFSGVVASLSTFFLSEDLRLLLAAPIPQGRLFLARFIRTVGQASWMVTMFLTPVLLGVGAARCAPLTFYVSAVLTIVPFAAIPVAMGAGTTLLLVNVLPARRARDVLMLVSLLFAVALVLILRFIQPERLLRVESLPDIADFFANLQSPLMPLLPSFWAGESLFAELQGGRDLLHGAALWTTALASTVLLGAAARRWHFAGYSRSQEAARARVSQLRAIDAVAHALPLSDVRRQLFVKDMKVFLRDVSQWLQLLPLFALVLLYLYNFRTLDLERIPYMSGFLKNVYALVNLAMAGFVVATVAVRFVFPAVSTEGAAFWIVRTSPISLRDFLWSKFWTGLIPLLVFIEGLTIAANELMGVDPVLKVIAAVAVAFMTVALVGLAVGLGARYPRFGVDPTQAAGSYGGVAFMVLAVLYVIIMIVLLGWPSSMWLFSRLRGIRLSSVREALMVASFVSAVALSVATSWLAMRSGVLALERMNR
ncbi:MAG: putative ABC transporter permease subunit [Vicinamibacterales bacterium]